MVRSRSSVVLGLVVLLWVPGTGAGGEDEDAVLLLRQEYNQVAASIDTLVRLHGGKQLDRLAARPAHGGVVPAGFEVVLLFWADDEAEIFLNDYRISETRLTPTQVVIPSLYFQERNLLRAHCWDTDRVESGFMAGLYLRDGQGGLRQVLVTEEGEWWVDGERAEERFYTHTQPEIPGAQVLWGPALFGECWLERRFDAGVLRQAMRQSPRTAADLRLRERSMEAHEVVSRLVRLQERRQELEILLAHRQRGEVSVRYQGYLNGGLSFTLGRAGPLAEERSIATSSQLYEWATTLPPAQRSLVFRERRELKGVEGATPEREFTGGGGGEQDRRADYQPPPERGPVEEGAGGMGRGGRESVVLFPRRVQGWLVVAGGGLILYLGAVGRQWWRLFNGKVWKG